MNWADANNVPVTHAYYYNLSKNYYEVSQVFHSQRRWESSIDNAIHSIEILAALELGNTPTGVAPDPAGGASVGGTTTGSTATTGGSATQTGTMTGGTSSVGSAIAGGTTTMLPSQYTVRPWAASKDCLWNIAGYPWVYGDPRRWPELYEANKARMPEPNNPDLIHPGFVINIPGENRQGMWDPNITYLP